MSNFMTLIMVVPYFWTANFVHFTEREALSPEARPGPAGELPPATRFSLRQEEPAPLATTRKRLFYYLAMSEGHHLESGGAQYHPRCHPILAWNKMATLCGSGHA